MPTLDITPALCFGPDLEVAAWNDHRMAMAFDPWDWCVPVCGCVTLRVWGKPSRVLERRGSSERRRHEFIPHVLLGDDSP